MGLVNPPQILTGVKRLGVDWCIGLQFTCDNKEFLVLNVYTSYECRENEDDYLNKQTTSWLDHCI